MTYPKALVIAAALISGSFLLSSIATSQQTTSPAPMPVMNIALAQSVEETSAMQNRASWVWVMMGHKLYACRIDLGQSHAANSKTPPHCTDPAEIN